MTPKPSIFILILLANTLLGCSGEPSQKPQQASTQGIVGEWGHLEDHPILGRKVSIYTFNADGSVKGETAIQDGLTTFIGIWGEEDDVTFMQGKLMTIVGTSTNSIDHTALLRLLDSETLEIDGTPFTRQ